MAQQKGNGAGVTEFVTGTLVAKSNIKAVKIDAGFDISGQDDATGEAVERILQTVQPLMYMGVSSDAASDIINGQDETNYDGVESNGVFVGGEDHAALDVITLSDGSNVTINAVDALNSNVVTEFTITTVGGSNSSEGDTLTQSATTGSGTGFSVTLGGDNVAGGGGIFHAIVDGSQFDAGAVQAQLRAIGGSYTDVTVTLGTSIVVS